MELAEAGKLRTCPTRSLVGTTPALASLSFFVETPAAAAIAFRVSPDTTVWVPAAAVVVEFARLGPSRENDGVQTGTASAVHGRLMRHAATARAGVPEKTRAEAKDQLAKRARRNADFIFKLS